MAFELGTTPSTFPLIQFILGGFFLWLGINLRIVFETSEDTTEE